MSSTNSYIYSISRIQTELSYRDVEQLFNQMGIGIVMYIDFQQVDSDWQSAIIYTTITHPLTETKQKLHDYIQMGNNYYYNLPYRKKYWIVTKFKHEKRRCAQPIKLSDQQVQINKLEEHVSNLQSTCYQIVGGLFCHETQDEELSEFQKMIFGDGYPARPTTNKWTFHPTTRQGDACEERITALEDQIERLLAQFQFPEDVDDDLSSLSLSERDYDN